VEIWRSLLGRGAVDDGTNFFLAGGNSLLALRCSPRSTTSRTRRSL
jgi:hypothetical protein